MNFKASPLFLVLVLAVFGLSYAQEPTNSPVQKLTLPELSSKLRSSHWDERSDALDQIRSDPKALRSRELRSQAIKQLDEATKGTDSGDEIQGEEYAEYFSSLCDLVASIADWRDARQVCVLVNAGEVDYPDSTTEAAARAKVAIPCILQMHSDIDKRPIAIPMLLEASARGRDLLDTATIQNAQQTIFKDLHDSDVNVRAAAVDAERKFGGTDVIPTLQQIAVSDPASEKRSDDVVWFPIRESAVDAITAIQLRVAQQQKMVPTAPSVK
jgi:hypothetical protein